MWQSSKICAHCIAAAEIAHCLGEFIQWYNKSKSKPNFHKLSKVDMPKGTERKDLQERRNGVAPHVILYHIKGQILSLSRKACLHLHSTHQCLLFIQLATAYVTLFLPVCQGYPHQIHGCICLTTKTQVLTQTLLLPKWQIIFHSIHLHHSHLQMWNTSFQPLSDMQQQTFTHPFFVRFLVGNIRICQGCRGSLRLPDGSLLSPPNDIVVARLERRPYFDKTSGTWSQPQKETNIHYHLKLSCVVKADPLFVPSTLQVSTDLDLLPVHMELISTEFGVTFNE